MKRLLAAAVLAIVLVPFAAPVVHARDRDDREDRDADDGYGKHYKKPKPYTKATEMASLGLASAVVIGGAGYLVLRRRSRKAT
jgi:hypothetical protein